MILSYILKVQWFCLISWRLFDVCTSYFGSMNQYNLTFDLKIYVGNCDLYSMVQWFCLISWRLFDMNIIIWDYGSVWPDIWPQNKQRLLWSIFHGPVILRYSLKTVWYMNIILWDYGSVWPNVWPQNKYRSMWPIFHGPVILSYLQDYLMHECHIFRVMDQCDSKIDLVKYVWVSDLYVKVHWLCHISFS